MDKQQYEANKLKEKVAIPRKVKVDGKEVEVVEVFLRDDLPLAQGALAL